MELKELISNWVDQNKETIITLLKDLVAISSINPYFDDDTQLMNEGDVQEYIKKYIEKLGFVTEFTYPDAIKLERYKDKPGYHKDHKFIDRPNLYGELKGNGEGKSILLTGHVDVVQRGNGWTVEPFIPVIKNGKIYGRGTVDMKGGIAAMIAAVQAIVELNIKLSGDIKIGTVVDEEAGGMGTLAFIAEGYRADGCILTEPTDLRIAPLCRGILWGKIVIEGKSGHIELSKGEWRHGGAVDSIEKSMHVIKSIKQLNKDWNTLKIHDYLALPCEIKLAEIHSGMYPTTFSNRTELVFNAQYLPREKDENGLGSRVKEEIEAFIANVAMTDPWLALNPPKIEWILDADCGETPVDSEFIKSLIQSMNEISKNKKTIEGTTSHTDMGWFTNVGIPTINYGPGKPMLAHQVDEYLDVDDLITATKEIAFAIINWVGIKGGSSNE